MRVFLRQRTRTKNAYKFDRNDRKQIKSIQSIYYNNCSMQPDRIQCLFFVMRYYKSSGCLKSVFCNVRSIVALQL